MKAIFLAPIPITKDNLNVVIDAGWIPKDKACEGAMAGAEASFRSGHRNDIASIAEIAHAKGALVLADSYQAIGAIELDVRSLGAETVIDYQAGDYLDGSRQYDVIVDIGGRNSLRRLRKALVRTGTLVIVGGEGGDRLTGGFWRQMVAPLMSLFVPQRLTTFVSEEHYRHIEALAGFIERGEVTPAVGRTYQLDEVAAAIDDLTSGKAQGKSAIVVR